MLMLPSCLYFCHVNPAAAENCLVDIGTLAEMSTDVCRLYQWIKSNWEKSIMSVGFAHIKEKVFTCQKIVDANVWFGKRRPTTCKRKSFRGLINYLIQTEMFVKTYHWCTKRDKTWQETGVSVTTVLFKYIRVVSFLLILICPTHNVGLIY